jgi:DNA-binding beta-propeller fold protein YncE
MGATGAATVRARRGGRARLGVGFLVGAALLVPSGAALAARARVHESVGFQLFESPQVNPIVYDAASERLFVANTTSDVVTVTDATSFTPIAMIETGEDPAALAIRPGANEVWVANHVSDTVQVIDIAPGSPTRYRVVDTIQSIDAQGVTAFDEPLGIAFTADGAKAFVALTSRDAIAVIDATARTVTGSIKVRAQEPRAIAVRNGLLYVASFQSGNQSELSVCGAAGDTNASTPCSLNLNDLVTFATNPNIPGRSKHIQIDPDVPDRDVFVYDATTHAEVAAVTGVGTLLYGVAVSSTGRAFFPQTDARNAVNGNHGQTLSALGNRMFTNEVAAVTCTGAGCGAVQIKDLEPANTTDATALATPYAVALSDDDTTLVVTAAGSSRVVTLDAATLDVLDTLDLGSVANGDFGQQIPRGVALRMGAGGAPQTAFVLNTFENTVSVIDVTNPANLVETTQFGVGADPTPEAVRRGRVAFHNAFASTKGTFSCASCHPDGNVDDLLWRIGGRCFLGGCGSGDEARTTMPVRGLKNTLPLHWDGTLGDPFGGGNGAVGFSENGGTDCSLDGADGDHDCFVALVNGSLSGVMCDQTGSCPSGGNELTAQERDDMAFYLAAVSYPPARSRRIDDTLSTPAAGVPVPNPDGTPSATLASAHRGFQRFFVDNGGAVTDPDTCADSTAGCHALPLGAATNSSTLNGFDVPTMRGLTDRVLQFSLGPTGAVEMIQQASTTTNITIQGFPLVIGPMETPILYDGTQGLREISVFGTAFLLFQPVYAVRPLDIWQMIEEASTGYSGAVARQVPLNARSTAPGELLQTETLLAALELADTRGLANLRVEGTRNGGAGFAPVILSYRTDGTYKNAAGDVSLSRAQLLAEAQAGKSIVTATGALRSGHQVPGTGMPQPLLGVGTGTGVSGDPPLPNLAAGGGNPAPFTVIGTDVRADAIVLLDGVPDSSATLTCSAGTTGSFCNNGSVAIDLATTPAIGLHRVQVLNPTGPISNELPFCVGTKSQCRSN